METIKLKEGAEIPVKRFYLPGVMLSFDCRKCGKLMEKDYSIRYLSFPVIGQQSEHIYCQECDTEHEMIVNLNVSIEFDRTTLKAIK